MFCVHLISLAALDSFSSRRSLAYCLSNLYFFDKLKRQALACRLRLPKKSLLDRRGDHRSSAETFSTETGCGDFSLPERKVTKRSRARGRSRWTFPLHPQPSDLSVHRFDRPRTIRCKTGYPARSNGRASPLTLTRALRSNLPVYAKPHRRSFAIHRVFVENGVL